MRRTARPPLVVIGSGIAGLSTALAAAPREVHVISASDSAFDCASALAMGGIAAAGAIDDSPALHAADSLRAGAGSNRRAALRLLTESAPAAIAWLQRNGVRFDADADGHRRALEGGHSRPRILHIGGDRSGAGLVSALHTRLQHSAHARLRLGLRLSALRLRGGAVDGLRLRDRHGIEHEVDAPELVLACGGPIGALADTTHPAGSDGAGLLLAMQAGARPRDLHYIQFHPTALAVDSRDRLPLMTEALRGAGARLLDADGCPLMAGLHPLGDLAPRDIVARRVYAQQRMGRPVWLQAQTLPINWTQQFPTVLQHCLDAGIDPRREPIPVRSAAHFHMGGIDVDLHSCSTLPGLFAVGEVACTGVHGGNRLASNSLLEAVVFGRALGERLSQASTPKRRGKTVWVELGQSADSAQQQQLRRLASDSLGPVRERRRVSQAIQALQSNPALSWQADLLQRLLRSALAQRRSHGAHWWKAG